MSSLIEPVSVQTWTPEEIYQTAGSLVRGKLDMDLSEFVEMYLTGEFDSCEYIEIVSLLSLLPEDDKYYVGAARKDAA